MKHGTKKSSQASVSDQGFGVPLASSLSLFPHYFLKGAQILLKNRIATTYYMLMLSPSANPYFTGMAVALGAKLDSNYCVV